ncbi:MAG: hypothetical protein HOP20_05545 [Sulfuriferula sp.]|nr:hypothetical protein [Sulfuriferula sp.]
MNQIEGEGYKASIDEAQQILRIEGTLRLNGLGEYVPISAMLSRLLLLGATPVLDLTSLGFLNSSGIAVLSKFVIEARTLNLQTLRILGAESVPWQGKSLRNLQRLMPALTLELI